MRCRIGFLMVAAAVAGCGGGVGMDDPSPPAVSSPPPVAGAPLQAIRPPGEEMVAMLLLREAAKKEAELSRRESDVQRSQSEIDTRERFANTTLAVVSLVISAIGLVPLLAWWRGRSAAKGPVGITPGDVTGTPAPQLSSGTQSLGKSARRRKRRQR